MLITVKPTPSKVDCYKEGAKFKTYSITLKSDEHLFQKRFQETPSEKEKDKYCYKIEAKMRSLNTDMVLMWLGHQVFST